MWQAILTKRSTSDFCYLAVELPVPRHPRPPVQISLPQNSTQVITIVPNTGSVILCTILRQCNATCRLSSSRRGSRSSNEQSETQTLTLKEVVLLPCPTDSKVPKCRGKLRHQECGLISDGCGFDCAWSESQVRQFISTLFTEKLKDRQGVAVRWVFIKNLNEYFSAIN